MPTSATPTVVDLTPVQRRQQLVDILARGALPPRVRSTATFGQLLTEKQMRGERAAQADESRCRCSLSVAAEYTYAGVPHASATAERLIPSQCRAPSLYVKWSMCGRG